MKKAGYIINIVCYIGLVVCLTAAFRADTPTIKPYPKQQQSFRFMTDPPAIGVESGEKHVTLEPYTAFRLGVIQLSGPKHANKSLLLCYPQDVITNGQTRLDLVCDDGSEFGIIGIEFPEKP